MKKRKPSSGITAMIGENPQIKAKEGSTPLGIKAILNSAKKVKSPSASSGENDQIAAKPVKENEQIGAKGLDHSDAYLERLKKRLNK